MPPIPRGGFGGLALFFRNLPDQGLGRRRSDAMEPVFCSAVRTTFVGSMTPAVTRFSYCLSGR